MTPTAPPSRILLLVDRRTPSYRGQAPIRRYRLVRARLGGQAMRSQIRK